MTADIPFPPSQAPYGSSFYSQRDQDTRASAEAVVPVVQELGPFRSVIDVGCGVGTWLSVFAERGADDVFGVEGDWLDPGYLEIAEDRFRFHDLRRPLPLDRSFELAVSLEVAEHLPPECAEDFVTTLTRLAPVVLFSAAVPFQGGRNHLNERWPGYWAELFDRAGFAVADAVRRHVWQNPRVRPWYAQNTLLYVRRDQLERRPRLAAEVNRTDPRHLALVHPSLYERRSDPRRQSLSKVVRALPGRMRRALGRS